MTHLAISNLVSLGRGSFVVIFFFSPQAKTSFAVEAEPQDDITSAEEPDMGNAAAESQPVGIEVFGNSSYSSPQPLRKETNDRIAYFGNVDKHLLGFDREVSSPCCWGLY